MHDFSKEIRTPKKNLLVGILTRENNDIYLIVKNRGKIDKIAIEMLLALLLFSEPSGFTRRTLFAFHGFGERSTTTTQCNVNNH